MDGNAGPYRAKDRQSTAPSVRLESGLLYLHALTSLLTRHDVRLSSRIADLRSG
jgi:hypothetical protein